MPHPEMCGSGQSDENKPCRCNTTSRRSVTPHQKPWRALGESNPSCKIENLVGTPNSSIESTLVCYTFGPKAP